MAAVRTLASIDAALGWFAQRGVRALVADSRRVRPGDAFIAWPGHAVDARRFVPQALAAGASACLVEADGAAAFGFDAADAIATLPQLKARAGEIASAFMGVPSARVDMLAVTGTNGKTSTAWWLAQALAALGRRCGVVGTLGIGEVPALEPTGLTTPDPVTLQAALQRFAEQGVAACAIEASSIGIVEHRLAGCRIAVAVFTNFTQDHLDYHATMQAYWQAKASLFDWPGLRATVVNVDAEPGAQLAAALRLRGLDLWTCAVGGAARLRADAVEHGADGLRFAVREGDASVPVSTALVGDYNVANLLGVIATLRTLGFALDAIAAACAQLTPVPGRLQRVPSPRGPEVVVDYAHSPDALEKALGALRPLARSRGGALWCVFGCGGNRDAAKRPLMGAVAQRFADHVVVTSDNPRGEVPAAIIAQIMAGLRTPPAARVVEDRRAAIALAIARAAPADVILLAGKGHEDYQEVAGVRQPFSDLLEARAALERRA